MWKKLVRAMLVTGERTCCRAWMTLTRNASTALRLKRKEKEILKRKIQIMRGLTIQRKKAMQEK
jgi:hypothetical protein